MKTMSLQNSLNGNMGSKRVTVYNPDSRHTEYAVDKIKVSKQQKPVRFQQQIACFVTTLRRDSFFKNAIITFVLLKIMLTAVKYGFW